jgi:nicotinamidase-related amidase
MPTELKINIKKTALVVIDLQKGITAINTEPYTSKIVVENTVKILRELRKNKMSVFLVHVTPSPDLKDALRPVAETSYQMLKYDPSWSEFVPELNIQSSDFIITKHQ